MSRVLPVDGLLESPPFPGIVTDVASVDGGGAEEVACDPATARAVARAMARARVGGAFWGRQVAGRSRLVVLPRGSASPAGDLRDTVLVAPREARRDAIKRGALVITDEADPWPLLDAADVVVCPPGDKLGILALAAGKRVTAPDGTPLDDEGGALFSRLLLRRRYRDPHSRKDIDCLAAIGVLQKWRTVIDGNRGLAAAAGMAFWKRREVARLLWDGRSTPLPFLKPDAAIERAKSEGGAVAAWPARVPSDFAVRAAAAGVQVRWVEDGFLRSAGLGSDLLPPLSLIVDDQWPYFDPARPSTLEQLLETTLFGSDLLARARVLRETIVARRIGKYRAGGAAETLDIPAGARLVVVIGQVEDDLSVLRGGHGLTNLALIERTRGEEPDAFVIYRPHPDVEAGHRRGAVPEAVAERLVDRIDRGGSIDALLACADTVHTLTSLTGFEALMRGVRVVVHGTPFYAGWGLTDDRAPPTGRRSRRLKLDELVAGALILYPRYLDPQHGLPCTPEQFIEQIGHVSGDAGWLVRVRRWQGQYRRLLG